MIKVEHDFLQECEQVLVWDLPEFLRWRMARANGLQDENDERLKFVSCASIRKVRRFHPTIELFAFVCENYRGGTICNECIAGSVAGANHFDDRWIQEFVKECKRRKKVEKDRLLYATFVAEMREQAKSRSRTPTV